MISVALLPIVKLTSETEKHRASSELSPVTATIFPWLFSACTNFNFYSGLHLATTLIDDTYSLSCFSLISAIY